MISTSNIIFWYASALPPSTAPPTHLILWWRQPGKDDAENDDAADTPDGTDTDTADAEENER